MTESERGAAREASLQAMPAVSLDPCDIELHPRLASNEPWVQCHTHNASWHEGAMPPESCAIKPWRVRSRDAASVPSVPRPEPAADSGAEPSPSLPGAEDEPTWSMIEEWAKGFPKSLTTEEEMHLSRICLRLKAENERLREENLTLTDRDSAMHGQSEAAETELESVQRDREALQAKIAELETDAERLDLLEHEARREPLVLWSGKEKDRRRAFDHPRGLSFGETRTLRQALDQISIHPVEP